MINVVINNIEKSNTVSELADFIKLNKNKEVRSNFVFTFDYIEKLVNDRKALIVIGNNVAILLEEDNDNILRLYFYAKDLSSLSEIKSLIPNSKYIVICDVVGKNPKAEKSAEELTKYAGMKFYAKFQRMCCRDFLIDNTLDTSEVELAKESDAEDILKMTYAEFDKLTARIPTKSELLERIKKQEVFVLRKKDEIAGFASFDSNNKKVALLDHVIVKNEYRREKIAKKIFSYKCQFYNTSQFYILWINVNCLGPIAYHKSNGFKSDGMYDYILMFNQKEV